MYCNKCGAQLPDEAKFCTKCGNRMDEDTPNITVEEDGDAKGKASKKNIGLIIGIIAAAVVLVIVLAFGGIVIFGDGEIFGLSKGSSSGQDSEVNTLTKEDDDIDIVEADDENADADIDETAGGDTEDVLAATANAQTVPVDIVIRQVDNSNFPEVTFYASIVDADGNVVENVDKSDFKVQEIGKDGTLVDCSIDDVYQVINSDSLSMNLVLDASGSMDYSSKMSQAKNAAKTFIDKVDFAAGNRVEIISFDDYVYLQQEFTRDENMLVTAVEDIVTGGSTALFDAIYAGLFQTYYETGVKCVIAFTDGEENASSYSFDDVVTMSQNTSIPVFIIGIGSDYNVSTLQDLASACSGAYYSASEDDLEQILTDIYLSIYEQQQDYYVFKYETTATDNLTEFRDISLTTADTSVYVGSTRKEYVPQSDISGAFSDEYMDMDYMLDFSSDREVTEDDLEDMSLAQLRIARNEIFARHGRQFKDSMLNQWFYSKSWYLDIPAKYAPDYFDSSNPNPLSKLERENVEMISDYEKNKMATEDIFPDAATVELTDYDLALSKQVLKTALAQVRGYSQTTIRDENIAKIEDAIDRDDVDY